MKCIISKQCAPQNIVDGWGNVVLVGSFYIEGIFDEWVEEYEYVFKLLEYSPITYILSFGEMHQIPLSRLTTQELHLAIHN